MSKIKKVTLKGGDQRYVVYFRDDTGKSKERRFPTRHEAVRFETSTNHALFSGDYIDAKAGRTPFRICAEDWRINAAHVDTTATVVKSRLTNHVYPTLGDRPIGAIQQREIQRLIKALSLELAPTTVEVIYRHIVTIFQVALTNRVIARTPCEKIDLPKRSANKVVPLPVDTVLAIIEAISPRFRNLLKVVAGTGLRQGEIFGLAIDRVDFLHRTIRVDQQIQLVDNQPVLVPLKSAASYRTIPVTQSVLDAINNQIKKYGLGPDGLIFTGRTGKPLRRNSFYSVWTPVKEAFNLPKGTALHAFRHFYASLLIRAGVSVKVVQERLGHASAMETLDTYGHLWEDDGDRTREAVDGLFGTAVETHDPADEAA